MSKRHTLHINPSPNYFIQQKLFLIGILFQKNTKCKKQKVIKFNIFNEMLSAIQRDSICSVGNCME